MLGLTLPKTHTLNTNHPSEIVENRPEQISMSNSHTSDGHRLTLCILLTIYQRMFYTLITDSIICE